MNMNIMTGNNKNIHPAKSEKKLIKVILPWNFRPLSVHERHWNVSLKLVYNNFRDHAAIKVHNPWSK